MIYIKHLDETYYSLTNKVTTCFVSIPLFFVKYCQVVALSFLSGLFGSHPKQPQKTP